MNNKGKRVISLVLTAVLTTSLLVGTGYNATKAEDISKQDIKTLMIQQMKDKLQKQQSKALTKKDSTKETEPAKNPNEKVRIIVQLNDKPLAESSSQSAISIKAEENSIKADQNKVIAKVEGFSGASIRHSYTNLVDGFSMDVKRSDIPKIKAMTGVKCVTEATIYKPDMTFANKMTQACSTWKDYGYKGEGMVVAIIDTGIDIQHKDMKLTDPSKAKIKDIKKSSETTFTAKVPYGHNFADNNDDVKPADGTSPHGMHVAGIVGANGDQAEVDNFKAIKGVAPEAQLLAMKVFSNNPNTAGGFDDDIIAAIEDSVAHGADIINMSLGADAGFQDPNDPMQEAISNATDKGVICVISAGNSATSLTQDGWDTPPKNMYSGVADTAMVGDPGTAKDAITVASYENSDLIAPALDFTSDTENGSKIVYAISEVEPSTVLTNKDGYEIVDCGQGNNAAEGTGNDFDPAKVTGKIALVQKVSGTFADKKEAAQAAGAIGVIFYNAKGDENLYPSNPQPDVKIPSASIGYSAGIKLQSLIPYNLKVQFKGEMSSTPNLGANDMSPYSSWGPTPSLDFKPEITAPGGDIYSTVTNNGYESMSGTSMASPNMAGAEALIVQSTKSKKLNLSGRDLVEFAKRTAINTAKVEMDSHFGNGQVPYSPRRQGAGLVQIEDAIKNNVTITDKNGDAAVSLKEIGKQTSFTLNLKNYGNTPVTYSLGNGGVLSETAPDQNNNFWDYSIEGSSMNFDKNTVTVPANGTATVNVSISLPDNLSTERFVEGYVKFNCSDGKNPSLSVPYMSFYGDWSKPNLLDKPTWDKDSITKLSMIYSYIMDMPLQLGFAGYDDDFNEIIDPNKIAISPNGDTFFDYAEPDLSILRNIKHMDVSIVDKNDGSEKTLRVLNSSSDIRKTDLEHYNSETAYADGDWDGKLYNPSTGKYETAPDGQYYMKFTSYADISNAKPQVMYMPVKVDDTAPVVDITSQPTAGDSSKYTLTWTDSDNCSGVNESVTGILVNGIPIDDQYTYPITVDPNTGVKSCTFDITPNQYNEVALCVGDYALNATVKEIGVDTPVIISSNIHDGITLCPASLNNSNILPVDGTVTDAVKSLKINGAVATINKDLTFTANVPLNDGKNILTPVALDAQGNVIPTNCTRTVFFDDTIPMVTLTAPTFDKNNTYVSDSNTVTIKGTFVDKGSDPSKGLVGIGISNSGGEMVTATPDKDGNFEANVDIDGTKHIYVFAMDAYGNEISPEPQEYIIQAPESKDPFAINFDNLDPITEASKKDVNNNVYTITGQINHKVKTFQIDHKDVTVNPDLTFSVDVPVQSGFNNILVYAADSDKQVYYNYADFLYYDADAPTLAISQPLISADGKIYTNEDSVKFKGTVGDDGFGYNLKINGNCITSFFRADTPGVDKNKQAFEYDVPVTNNCTIKVEATDFVGNSTTLDIPVVVDKTAPGKPAITEDKKTPTNKDVSVTIANAADTDINKTEYSFDNSKWSPYIKPFTVSNNITVYARSTDKAGNVSEVSSLVINNIDKTAPTITVTGVENGKAYNTTDNVKAAITTNDSSARVTATLDGNAYNGKAITQAGSHVLSITAVDPVGNTSTKTIKFNINAVVTNDSSSVTAAVNAVNNAAGSNVTVNIVGPAVLTSAFVDGVKASGKNITINMATKDSNNNDVVISFTAKAQDLKPIDFTLNSAAPNKDAITKIDGNAQILSFKDNGLLPASTTINVKIDTSKIDVKSPIYFYYYNPSTKKSELIAGPLTVNKDGYVTVQITHCSDYFFSNKSMNMLPKTGSFIDFNTLLISGALFMLTGVVVVYRKRKEKDINC